MAKHPEGENFLHGGSATHGADAAAFHEVWDKWAPPAGGSIKMASNETPVLQLPAPASDLRVWKLKDGNGEPVIVHEEPDYFANGGK